ncbi:MAG: exodeoxyribonuclease VII large subunit [Candidatus Aenigmatarchaeota archaeon]
MEDKNLLIICLIISIIGLVTTSMGVYLSEKEIITINEIKNEDEGKIVKISGNISNKYKSKDGHIFLEVKDKTDKIDIVLFKNEYKNMGIDTENLKKDNEIKVLGKVTEYQGNLEIISKRINII